MTKLITTPDSRTLALCEVGDPKGPLVLHNHGGPSSRLEAKLFADAAARHGLRFICVDRPGMGQSSPEAHRSYECWARDLTHIADAMGGFLALHFEPGFRLMHEMIGFSAAHMRKSHFKELVKAGNDEDRKVFARPGPPFVMPAQAGIP